MNQGANSDQKIPIENPIIKRKSNKGGKMVKTDLKNDNFCDYLSANT